MDFSNTSDFELQDRFTALIVQYAAAGVKVADMLERFGRLRNELQLLSVEMKERNLPTEDLNA